jgi:hypothetical protein
LLGTEKGGTLGMAAPPPEAPVSPATSAVARTPAAAAETAVVVTPVAAESVITPPAPAAPSAVEAQSNTPARPAPKAAATKAAPAVATALPVAPPRKPEAAAPAVAAPSPLDVASLKARLRDTKAIGVFSKLALKNQMDDVLEQFPVAYKTGQKTAPATLRQPYEMLVLKVLALLQDGDPALARSVAGSREALWGILANADSFHALA